MIVRRRKLPDYERLCSESEPEEGDYVYSEGFIPLEDSQASMSEGCLVEEKPTEEKVSIPGFFDFCWSELTCGYSLQNDEKSYSDKRRKLYALFRIPAKVEKFLFFGQLQCFDAFLYFFTFLPLRFLISLTVFLRLKRWGSAELCDVFKVGIMVCSATVMFCVDTSVVYHVVRGQGVIKLYIFYNMLEVADKLFSSLGQDILEALFWTANESLSIRTALRTFFHFTIATTYAAFHTFLVLLQATTLNVAFNSHNQAVLAILMSNNFVELKGSVFKKFAKANLFQLTCSDVRERFHLLMLLTVVLLRNLAAVNWSGDHFLEMMPDVLMVIGAEVLVDWLKHAFITKFNEINADVYKDFTMTIAFDVVKNRDPFGAFNAYSDQVSRRMGFIPIPLAVMLIRVLGQTFNFVTPSTLIVSFVFWLLLFAVKVFNGILLLGTACKHVIAFRKLQECARDQHHRQKMFMAKSKSVPSSPKMSLVDFTDVCHQTNAKNDLTASDVLNQMNEIQIQRESLDRGTIRTRRNSKIRNKREHSEPPPETAEVDITNSTGEDDKQETNERRRPSSKPTEDDLATVTAYTMLPPDQGVERIE